MDSTDVSPLKLKFVDCADISAEAVGNLFILQKQFSFRAQVADSETNPAIERLRFDPSTNPNGQFFDSESQLLDNELHMASDECSSTNTSKF